jgi:hypothetical protein
VDCSQVLRRLLEIERAVGVLDSLSIRKMLIETQDYILESQKDSLRTARMNAPCSEVSLKRIAS